ncbi:hypothetical protein J1614_011229, partial [Plenodomus biglobosus]
MFISTLATILALSAATHGILFNGPLPTPAASPDANANANGWSPKPTPSPPTPPSHFPRNSDENSLCGYVQGLAQFPLSCKAGACHQNSTLNWFGCCPAGTDNCNMATRCVPAASIDACLADAECAADQHVMGCSESSAPFCVQIRTVAAQATLSHFVCAPTQTQVVVEGTAVAVLGSASVGVAALGTVSAVTMSKAVSTGGADQGVVVGSGGGSADGVGSTVGGQSGSGGSNVAPATTLVSTAGAAVQTARALVGAAGGFVGAVAMLL